VPLPGIFAYVRRHNRVSERLNSGGNGPRICKPVPENTSVYTPELLLMVSFSFFPCDIIDDSIQTK